MDDRTRAATYQDVRRVAEHVAYALIGGYALALQGIVRLTEDVDILVEPTAENAKRWVRVCPGSRTARRIDREMASRVLGMRDACARGRCVRV
jgi:hypothetical protein